MSPVRLRVAAKLARPMTKAAHPDPPSRYDSQWITEEIRKHRERLRWEIKDLAWEAGFGKTLRAAQDNWYKASRRHSWSVKQLGKIAAVLESPDCWPFREWTVELQKQFPGRSRP